MKKQQILLALLLFIPLFGNKIQEYQSTLSKSPKNFDALFNIGIEYFKAQEYTQAIEHLNKARELEPQHAQIYFNLGLVYMALDNYAQAATHFEKAINQNTHYGKAYYFLAQTYQKLKQDDAALTNYQKALSYSPDNVECLLSTARLLRNQNKTDQAIQAYQNAIKVDPKHIITLFDLAYLYTSIEKYEDAITWYKKLLAIAPDTVDATCNLAHVLRYHGRHHESIPYYQQILAKRPDFSHGHYGLAESYLILGDFERGLPEFEWRWKRSEDVRKFNNKLWDGSPIQGKTILLRAEYGQGDSLQFIRYAKQLKEMGATVIFEAQHSLVQLLSLCPYIDKIIPVLEDPCQLPAFDVQLPIMSLPHRFKTSLTTIPADIPYLNAKPELVAYWKEKIQNDKNFKIGICWEGSPYYEQFKSAVSKKAVPASLFVPLTQILGVSIYSLQKMNGLEQLQSLPANAQITQFGDSFDIDHGRFMDTAALIENLDLVITVDTSVAHLAGALGKPVWVLLPLVSDWRWMLNRTDSPWYPTMRLYRQSVAGDWQHVMQAIMTDLKSFSAAPQLKRSIKIEAPAPTNVATQTQTAKAPLSVITEVQVGELIDKITILEIKMERIKDPAKLKNIKAELDSLLETCRKEIPQSAQLLELWKNLRLANEKLWVIEDDIRDKERARDFDQKFIDLARSVYYTNDDRCKFKREINVLLGSKFLEEKSYTDYKNPNKQA